MLLYHIYRITRESLLERMCTCYLGVSLFPENVKMKVNACKLFSENQLKKVLTFYCHSD